MGNRITSSKPERATETEEDTDTEPEPGPGPETETAAFRGEVFINAGNQATKRRRCLPTAAEAATGASR
ncbi:hypothetical protein AWZ03_014237 [Drosophila navojoa]|uniref:Uncharacterized protein n=1 Tax=Drosophila navojoa TaxID=7232 RepID=A0A484ATY6_DRONA|nr:hypothetical protein AWZ03_014237 [Drosophila navojoa]